MFKCKACGLVQAESELQEIILFNSADQGCKACGGVVAQYAGPTPTKATSKATTAKDVNALSEAITAAKAKFAMPSPDFGVSSLRAAYPAWRREQMRVAVANKYQGLQDEDKEIVAWANQLRARNNILQKRLRFWGSPDQGSMHKDTADALALFAKCITEMQALPSPFEPNVFDHLAAKFLENADE